MCGGGSFYRSFLLKTPHLACSNTVSTTNLNGTKALKTLESILPRMAQLTGGVSGKLAKLKISFDLISLGLIPLKRMMKTMTTQAMMVTMMTMLRCQSRFFKIY